MTNSKFVPPVVAQSAPLAPASPSATARVENTNSLGDSPTPLQAMPGDASRAEFSAIPREPRLHLVLGPVGAGKSTFAERLARDHRAVRLTLDEWMTKLFSQDRPDHGVMDWYIERTVRCIEVIWTLATQMIDHDTNVVLEIGLLTRREREGFFERVETEGANLTTYVIDASRDVRRRRVEERNRARGSTFSMVVPPAIFDLASDLWESPDAAECEGRDVRFIRTDD